MDPREFVDVMYLAKTIWAEARGEGPGAMRAVAQVIVNRLRSGRYGRSIRDVVTARSQFSCWSPGDPNRAKMLDPLGQSHLDEEAFLRAVDIAQDVLLAPEDKNDLPGVLWYHDTSIAPPAWTRHLEAIRLPGIPRLIFYRRPGSGASANGKDDKHGMAA